MNKVGEDGNKLDGAEFGVFTSKDAEKPVYTFDGNSTVSTASLQDYMPAVDKDTTLYVKETKAPAGYTLSKDVEEVKISATQNEALDEKLNKYITTTTYTVAAESKTFTVKDTKNVSKSIAYGTVTINKTDTDNNPVKDAKFSIYQNKECSGTPLEIVTAGNTVVLTSDEFINPLLPKKANDTLTLYVKETTAPEGYDLNNTVFTVVITNVYNEYLDKTANQFIQTTAYNAVVDGNGSVINVADKKITDKADAYDNFTVNKVDENNKTVDGATFGVFTDEKCTGEAVYSFDGNKEVSVESLKKYLPELDKSTTLYVKETAAPAGYTLSDVVNPITISASEKEELKDGKFVTTTTYAVDEQTKTITVVDHQTDTHVKKTDDSNKALAGATLEVLDNSGKVVATWTTDGTEHSVKGLTVGAKYTLHEVSAPRGYELAADITFTVGNTAEAQVVTLVDKAIVLPNTNDQPTPTPDRPNLPVTPDRPETPKTSDETNAPLFAGAMGIAMMLAGFAFFFKKKYSD